MPSLDTIAAYIRARLPEPPTPGEIAAHFGISPRTVDHHRARILEKLGVKSLTEMIALVRPDELVD